MKEEPFLQVPNDVLYGMRLIVFLEESPQSNIYRQVLLDEKKFKKVSDSVCTVINKKGDMENVEIRLSDESYLLPDLPEIKHGEHR